MNGRRIGSRAFLKTIVFKTQNIKPNIKPKIKTKK
jgi:hypothetical protein